MNRIVLVSALLLAALPAYSAGLPALNLPASQAGAVPQPGALPLAPVSLDLGASTPGFGGPFHFAPPPGDLPGLAQVIPYADNTGTGGRFNGDVEVDTVGQRAYAPVIVYGLVFTDPPKHPLHLVGNLDGMPINKRIDQP